MEPNELLKAVIKNNDRNVAALNKRMAGRIDAAKAVTKEKINKDAPCPTKTSSPKIAIGHSGSCGIFWPNFRILLELL